MPNDFEHIKTLSPEKRYQYLLKQVSLLQEIWILTDEHGCVMLNTEDEDCVPIWPSKDHAEAWATGDWSNCSATVISKKDWHQRWTNGLQEDDLALAIFPNPNEDGLVILPEEFEHDLRAVKI